MGGIIGRLFKEFSVTIGAAILISGFAGTYAGTHYLRRMPEETFRRGFKTLLTVIAIYLIVAAIVDFRTG